MVVGSTSSSSRMRAASSGGAGRPAARWRGQAHLAVVVGDALGALPRLVVHEGHHEGVGDRPPPFLDTTWRVIALVAAALRPAAHGLLDRLRRGHCRGVVDDRHQPEVEPHARTARADSGDSSTSLAPSGPMESMTRSGTPRPSKLMAWAPVAWSALCRNARASAFAAPVARSPCGGRSTNSAFSPAME